MSRRRLPGFVGPHEGRELRLMKAGKKPLSLFIGEFPSSLELFPEKDFDVLVSGGRLVKHVSIKPVVAPDGRNANIRQVLYALPEESWRINACLLAQELYDSFPGGWRPDLDRLIGLLLGYERSDIEQFLNFHDK